MKQILLILGLILGLSSVAKANDIERVLNNKSAHFDFLEGVAHGIDAALLVSKAEGVCLIDKPAYLNLDANMAYSALKMSYDRNKEMVRTMPYVGFHVYVGLQNMFPCK